MYNMNLIEVFNQKYLCSHWMYCLWKELKFLKVILQILHPNLIQIQWLAILYCLEQSIEL
jgi:hypothetical protein